MTEETALVHLEQFRTRLMRESRGVVLVTGLHREPMRHAHGVLKLSRRQRIHVLNATEAREWLQLRWTHGEVWCVEFDSETYGPRASLTYLARHVETVTA